MSGLGHARERRPGRWELRVYAGRDPLNPARKRYATKTVAAISQRDADRALAVFAAGVITEGAPAADLTVGELLERWYRFAAPRMVPAGRAEARSIIDTRLKPLAEVKLSRLTGPTGTATLDDLYVALRERGRLCRRRTRCEGPCEHGGGGPLAESTVIRTHVVLHAALEQAVKWGLASRNPAEHAWPGEADAEEVDPPAPEEVLRLFELAEAEDPELVVLLVLTATTGARRGAALAVQWDEVDLETGLVTFGHVLSIGPDGVERVRRGKGKRNRKGGKQRVPLDPSVLAILLAHRARCEARCRLAGVELRADGYVFAADGAGNVPWRPDSTTRRVRRIRDAVGLTGKPIHDLRHFVVTYLIASGVDLVTVKELVGHAASSRTTVDVYGHALTSKTRAATGILARLLELDGASPGPAPAGPAGADVIPLRRTS